MAYQFVHSESVKAGVRRIINEKIDAALGHLADAEEIHIAAHEARKRVKEIRAVLRLIRSELDGFFDMENAAFRAAARELAPLREAQAMVESLEKLRLRYRSELGPRAFWRVARSLRMRRDEILKSLSDLGGRMRRSREALRQARARVPAWPLESESFEAIEGGLHATYQSGRRAFRAAVADPSPENFHRWRKRVKDSWYHTQLLREIWPEVMKGNRSTLEELSQLLGDHHDLAFLRALISGEPKAFGSQETIQELLELIDARLEEMESAARVIGERIHADRPGDSVRRLRQYWDSWKNLEARS